MGGGLSRERLALEISRARKPFAVVIVLALLAVGACAYIVGHLRGGLPWQGRYTVRVAVDDAKGVIPGKQEVRISGLPVGLISKVSLDGAQPVLTLSIEPRYAPLYRDATLRLRPKTPLDDLYLDVESRGHPQAGKLGAGQVLDAQRTRTPVDIGRVLDTLDADTRSRTKIAIDELGRALPDRGVQLRAALTELTPFLNDAQRFTAALAVRQTQTSRLVHNLALMTGELGTRQHQLTELVRSGAASLTTIGQADGPLAATISQLPPTLHQLETTFATVRATADQLDPAFDALQPTARALPSGLAALRSFSTQAEPAIAALRRPLPSLAPLVRELRPTAADLDAAFAALRPQVPRLDRITAAIVPCELAVQKFFQNTISVFKFSSARAPFPRGHTIAGISTAGGLVNDPDQRAFKSCAPGAPAK